MNKIQSVNVKIRNNTVISNSNVQDIWKMLIIEKKSKVIQYLHYWIREMFTYVFFGFGVQAKEIK